MECRLMPFSELETVAESDDFPEEFFRVKVLPELLKSVEFGGGGPKPFGIVMRIATKMDEDEYSSQITPVIIRLFSSPDRALRVCLLDNLPHMIDHLSQKIVSDKIFPQMVTGFGDLAPLVREQTVKAVLVVVTKLSDRVVNGELLRHLAKTANDDQPGIRTNTTICLGKIARNLSPSSRGKVLTAAFTRALRDPFVHGRNAALMALAATADIYPEDDCASKMLPAICPCLVDKEKMIRDQANKTMNIYLDRIRKYATTLPDSVLPPPQPQSAGPTRVSSPQPTGSNQWMGWAISSFTNKLGTASGNIEPNSDGALPTPLERSSSTPPANGTPIRPQSHTMPSAPAVPRAPSNLRTFSSTPAADVEDEDFGDGWGDLDDNDTSVADAWGADEPASPPTTSTQSTKPGMPYDDGGEPDFEGWLNAQAAAKAKNSKVLPKGLTKKTPVSKVAQSKPQTIVKASPASKAVPAKKAQREEKKQEAVEDDDDWGEAWG
jgi:SCY1-like protein 1